MATLKALTKSKQEQKRDIDMNLESQFSAHEQVCAERYAQINARLKRLEGVIMKTAGVLIVSMSAIVYASLTFR